MDAKKLFFAAFLCLALPESALYAQEDTALTEQRAEERGEAEIDARSLTSAANELVQPFSWSGAGDVLKYEIVIDKLDEKTGQYVHYRTHVTNDKETERCLIYFDPLLPQGKYRSTIIVYNILGLKEDGLTSQDTFVVHLARKPNVRSVSYRNGATIYLNDWNSDGIIEASGENLFMPKKNNDDVDFTEYRLVSENLSIAPEQVVFWDEAGHRIGLKFDLKKLIPGLYHLTAQDISGLHSGYHEGNAITVVVQNLINLDISLSYSLSLPLHDTAITKYMEQIWPLSASIRMSFMPIRNPFGCFGFGLSASYARFETSRDSYSMEGNFASSHLNLVYRLPMLNDKLMIEARGGVGLAYLGGFRFHFGYGINSTSLNTLTPSFDIGLGIKYFISRRLFVDIFLDYTLAVNDDITLGMALPSVGIGWQF